ncbi:MAG: DUF2065 domain-containing protein [Alphaproteobacteria bacterium]|nr:DUF2065 domain-containing protein [Alphaproteobacteria bacterium]
MITEFVMALGFVLVIEGLLYALVPGQLKQMLLMLLRTSDDQLRYVGLVAMTIGVVVVWAARSLG